MSVQSRRGVNRSSIAFATALVGVVSYYIYTQRQKRKVQSGSSSVAAGSSRQNTPNIELALPKIIEDELQVDSEHGSAIMVSNSFESNTEPERTPMPNQGKEKEPECTVRTLNSTSSLLSDLAELNSSDDDIDEIENSSKPTARVFASKEETAKELCAFIAEQAREAIAARGVFYLALQGGVLLDLLTGLEDHKQQVEFDKVVISFANHFCINPTSDIAALYKSKVKFADAAGISKFITPTLIPRNGTDGTEEAEFYSMLLRDHGLPHSNGYPVLDLIVLALGSDGSVASCYPMSPAVNAKRAVVGSVRQGEPASITFTMRAINNAMHVAVVACSKGKQDAVKRAMRRPADLPRGTFPVQLLKCPIFFLAADAAGELEH